ncbi:MAG: 4Fe-4S double cluster binding domain-containing protein [Anaerolineae bacterium]
MMGSLPREIASFGASLVGFADIREFAPWPRAISIALALDPVILKGVKNGPTLDYYEEYLRANKELNEIAQRTARLLLGAGYEAEAFPATITDSDREPGYERTLRAAFQHKIAATRAGLGFIGKSGLLITPDFGPRVRLVTVFTDLPFPTGQPILEGRCGGCRLCVEACPVGAIRGREWRVGMAREELLDAHACRREAKRLLKERVGADEAVCGICVAICPRGQRVSTNIEKDS